VTDELNAISDSIRAYLTTQTEARDRAIKACDRITFPRAFYRRDIAWQAIESGAGAG